MHKDLIQKFLNNTCTEQERIFVLNYFKEHAIEDSEYFSEEDWEQHIRHTNTSLSSEKSESLYQNIREQSVLNHGRKPYRIWYVAAMLAVLVSIGVLFMIRTGGQGLINSHLSAQHTERNETMAMKQIVLPDGSIVDLHPRSEISYAHSFDHKRDIHLKGTAFFKVSKDPSKPFVVYQSLVSVRALGTEFLVESHPEMVKVTLFEGKVAVRNIDIAKSISKYLLPGDVLEYTIENHEMLVQSRPVTVAQDIAIKTKTHSSIPQTAVASHTLLDVLDLLAYQHKVKVSYIPEQLNGIHINKDRYNKTMSFEKTLAALAQQYHLNYHLDTDSVWVIERK